MVDVIIHENVHVMWEMIPGRRLRSLEEAAGKAAPRGERVWRLLHEALPTALGQGVGQARFHPVKFSRDESWYHVADVDRVAKNIYPIVERSIAEGRILDESLMAELVRAGS